MRDPLGDISLQMMSEHPAVPMIERCFRPEETTWKMRTPLSAPFVRCTSFIPTAATPPAASTAASLAECFGDPPSDKRPARRCRCARLRMRTPGDATPPGRGVSVPGVRLRGPSCPATMTRQKPVTIAAPVHLFAPRLRFSWKSAHAPAPAASQRRLPPLYYVCHG
jgi:hypothetical protein